MSYLPSTNIKRNESYELEKNDMGQTGLELSNDKLHTRVFYQVPFECLTHHSFRGHVTLLVTFDIIGLKIYTHLAESYTVVTMSQNNITLFLHHS